MRTPRIGRWEIVVAALLSWAAVSGLALARADEQADLRQKALSLNDITGDDPIEAQVKELVADREGTKKLLAVAVKMAQEKEQPFNFTAAFILANAARQLKDFDSAQALYRVCAAEALKLRSADKMAEAYLALNEILMAQKKYDEAVKMCKEVLEMKDEGDRFRLLKVQVLMQMIRVKTKQGNVDEAMKLVDNFVKAVPGSWIPLDLKGYVEHEAGKYEDAAKTWEEVLERMQKDDGKAKKDDNEENKEAKAEMERDIRNMHLRLSNVYTDLNQIDKAAEHLKVLLQKDPDDPGVNNDLGYIWADHDMNLDEAEKMIRKALDEDRKRRKKENPDLKPEEDKDNSAYLDSLGWVLFKKKKYQEAKAPLLEAIKGEEGKHVEIYDHLGDVHMALGEKGDAVAIWEKALKLDTEERKEKELKAKVEKKLKEAKGEKK
jgi:tetratricopeptide (TPR) repeat protein